MRTRPAHGGFPGEVRAGAVCRLCGGPLDERGACVPCARPATDPLGLVPLGSAWVTLDSFRLLDEATLAAMAGVTVEEVRQTLGWTSVRSRTQR